MFKPLTIKIHKSWKEIKQYKERHSKWILPNVKEQISNYKNFKELYLSSGGAKGVRDIKYYLRYNSRLYSVKAAKIKFKELGIKKKEKINGEIIEREYKTSELRKMSTHDLAEFMKDSIKAKYRELTGLGMKASEAKQEIAELYFGS